MNWVGIEYINRMYKFNTSPSNSDSNNSNNICINNY
jgi:hypothetical protein